MNDSFLVNRYELESSGLLKLPVTFAKFVTTIYFYKNGIIVYGTG